MREFIKFIKALPNPARFKMIRLIQWRVMCVYKIQEVSGLAQSTASKLIKILEESDLIACLKEGLLVSPAGRRGKEPLYG